MNNRINVISSVLDKTRLKIFSTVFNALDHAETLGAFADRQQQRSFEVIVALVIRQAELVETENRFQRRHNARYRITFL